MADVYTYAALWDPDFDSSKGHLTWYETLKYQLLHNLFWSRIPQNVVFFLWHWWQRHKMSIGCFKGRTPSHAETSAEIIRKTHSCVFFLEAWYLGPEAAHDSDVIGFNLCDGLLL